MTITQSKHPSGQFVLTVQSVYHSEPLPAGTVRINGEPFTIPYNQKKIIVPTEVHTFETVSKTQKLIEYQDKDGGAISVQLYNQTTHALLDEYQDEEGNWQDIDKEYAYKKFVSTWCHPIFETKEEFIKHEVVRKDLPQSEYADITPIYTLGWKDDNTNFLCEFNPNVPDITQWLAQKHGVSYVAGNRDSVQYAKINGEFVYKFNFSSDNQRRVGTYSEMVAARNKLIDLLEAPIIQQKRIKDNPTVSDVERKVLHAEVSACLSLANEIETNVKNRNKIVVLREKLYKMLNQL